MNLQFSANHHAHARFHTLHAPSRHDLKIVDWDFKPQHKQTNTLHANVCLSWCSIEHSGYVSKDVVGINRTLEQNLMTTHICHHHHNYYGYCFSPKRAPTPPPRGKRTQIVIFSHFVDIVVSIHNRKSGTCTYLSVTFSPIHLYFHIAIKFRMGGRKVLLFDVFVKYTCIRLIGELIG